MLYSTALDLKLRWSKTLAGITLKIRGLRIKDINQSNTSPTQSTPRKNIAVQTKLI